MILLDTKCAKDEVMTRENQFGGAKLWSVKRSELHLLARFLRLAKAGFPTAAFGTELGGDLHIRLPSRPFAGEQEAHRCHE